MQRSSSLLKNIKMRREGSGENDLESGEYEKSLEKKVESFARGHNFESRIVGDPSETRLRNTKQD